jgi:hypothetical protein
MKFKERLKIILRLVNVVLDIETLTETILCVQREERFVLGAQGGRVH